MELLAFSFEEAKSSTSVVIRIMARTARLGKEKRQSVITVRHEGQTIWKNNVVCWWLPPYIYTIVLFRMNDCISSDSLWCTLWCYYELQELGDMQREAPRSELHPRSLQLHTLMIPCYFYSLSGGVTLGVAAFFPHTFPSQPTKIPFAMIWIFVFFNFELSRTLSSLST